MSTNPTPSDILLSPMPPALRTVGLWSATGATFFAIAYVVGQLAEWTGLLGSQGGPESRSTLLGLVVLLTPSLFLGSSFLVLMVSVHQMAAPDRKIWSHAAVAFATAFLFANGLLLPFLALQMYFHPLIWIASLWAVTFPGSTWTLAIMFRRAASNARTSREVAP